jgi:ribonuclease P protein component
MESRAEPQGGNPRTFPKTARVLRSAEFRRIYDTGVRLPGPLFVAFAKARTEGDGARLGLTVPRAVGGSVQRSRIKRRLREAFRLRRERFGSYDIVLNPRKAILNAEFSEIERAMERVAAQIQERIKQQ